MLCRVGILLSQTSQEGTRGMKLSGAGLGALGGHPQHSLGSTGQNGDKPQVGTPLSIPLQHHTQMSARARSWLGEEGEKKGKVKPLPGAPPPASKL